jgi:glycosyltransferase involved in cell wall biosynthesis
VPKVSLIMTVHNREQYLSAAIDSVLAQTYKDFELLIWDDGSRDRSLAIAQKFKNDSPDVNIRVIGARRMGRADALRCAHTSATGRFVGWLDSDDWLEPEALEKTVGFLEKNSSVGMVYTDYWDVDQNGKRLGLGRRCSTPYSARRMLVEFMTFHFRLMRNSLYHRSGGIDTSFPCAMDYDLCLRISELAEVHHLNCPLYNYRIHDQTISTQQKATQVECSLRAVNLALMRRGMGNSHYVQFKDGSFHLLPRPLLPLG